MRVTVQDVADHFGVHKKTIFRWLREGTISQPAKRLPSGRRVWTSEDLKRIDQEVMQKQQKQNQQ